ncbi:MAG: superoxide dismutase family protein [Alphaproteobacteria bacterium]|nr:superoxide dismutase family protein [Alphaproteobacteria bacterium]
MKQGWLIIMAILAGCQTHKPQAKADIYLTGEADASKIGYVIFEDTPQGLSVKADLKNLPAGAHGFHIHENPDCGAMPDKNGEMQPALAAGGHFDPEHTGAHLGPHGNGHKGDMPAINAAADGSAQVQFFLQGLTVDEIKNRSVIIHAGGDNYKDTPLPLGGGGARIACGIIR